MIPFAVDQDRSGHDTHFTIYLKPNGKWVETGFADLQIDKEVGSIEVNTFNPLASTDEHIKGLGAPVLASVLKHANTSTRKQLTYLLFNGDTSEEIPGWFEKNGYHHPRGCLIPPLYSIHNTISTLKDHAEHNAIFQDFSGLRIVPGKYKDGFYRVLFDDLPDHPGYFDLMRNGDTLTFTSYYPNDDYTVIPGIGCHAEQKLLETLIDEGVDPKTTFIQTGLPLEERKRQLIKMGTTEGKYYAENMNRASLPEIKQRLDSYKACIDEYVARCDAKMKKANRFMEVPIQFVN